MKKLIIIAALAIAGLVANAAEPFVEVRQEFWGKTYFVLNDVNGIQYKFNPPTNGRSVKLRTKTGWYMVNSKGEITSYSDPAK